VLDRSTTDKGSVLTAALVSWLNIDSTAANPEFDPVVGGS
jgi:hypothetical protein